MSITNQTFPLSYKRIVQILASSPVSLKTLHFCFLFLTQVVACYRHLASCVGGCTDSLQLRDELRQTREKAQKLAASICHHLTSHLRDKSLPEEQRKEMELLWVAFSSSLELLHVDMCKVFSMGDIFSLANTATLVQTGLQGEYQPCPLSCMCKLKFFQNDSSHVTFKP